MYTENAGAASVARIQGQRSLEGSVCTPTSPIALCLDIPQNLISLCQNRIQSQRSFAISRAFEKPSASGR